MVFIVELQRLGHSPEVQHVRKPHELLRWMQWNPKKLSYKGPSSEEYDAANGESTIGRAHPSRRVPAGGRQLR